MVDYGFAPGLDLSLEILGPGALELYNGSNVLLYECQCPRLKIREESHQHSSLVLNGYTRDREVSRVYLGDLWTWSD
jgi:hypothetical protein